MWIPLTKVGVGLGVKAQSMVVAVATTEMAGLAEAEQCTVPEGVGNVAAHGSKAVPNQLPWNVVVSEGVGEERER